MSKKYVLNEGYELCGWEGLPFGLRLPSQKVSFFDKEEYRVVYACDGCHDVDEDIMTEKQKRVFDELKLRAIRPADNGESITENQEYRKYQGAYKDHVQWSITGRCNYKCRHCFMSAPNYHGEDLSMEQCVYILDEMEKCGIRNVSLTGGETLIFKDLIPLLDEMKKRKIHCPTIYSNGALVTEELLEELLQHGFHPNFHISFDGVGWHDWLRGIDGAEEAAIQAFKLCQEKGFTTSTSMCLHRHNIDSIGASIDLLESLGCKHIKMNVATPAGEWANEKEHFVSWEEAYEAVLNYLPSFIAEGKKISAQFCMILDYDKDRDLWRVPVERYPSREDSFQRPSCGAMRSGMYIGPTGNILPCMSIGGTEVEKDFPNILETPLADILSDSAYYTQACKVKVGPCIEHNEKCRECEYRYQCGGGCRAQACVAHNDFLGIDEETCYVYKSGYFDRCAKMVREMNAGKKSETELQSDNSCL